MNMSGKARSAGPAEDITVNDKEIPIIPFGMFELNAAGVVVHYSPASEKDSKRLNHHIVGQNFFDQLVFISQVEDVKNRFLNFMANGASVERFAVSFPYHQSNVKVQIVMAHVREKSENGREHFALLRVLPETHSPASSLTKS
jgi:photoactive yellow protein